MDKTRIINLDQIAAQIQRINLLFWVIPDEDNKYVFAYNRRRIRGCKMLDQVHKVLNHSPIEITLKSS